LNKSFKRQSAGGFKSAALHGTNANTQFKPITEDCDERRTR